MLSKQSNVRGFKIFHGSSELHQSETLLFQFGIVVSVVLSHNITNKTHFC